MYVSVRGQTDVLTRERGESVTSFAKKVVAYADSAELSVSDFCSTVCIENVTLKEAAEVYATVCRSHDSNVFQFERKKAGKVIRFPLWREEALG